MSSKNKWRQDYQLAVDFRSGNQSSGDKLYSEVDSLLFSYLHKRLDSYSVSKEDIQDLKIEIICKTLVDIHKYNGTCKFSTWVLGYANNYIYLKISELMKEQKKMNRLIESYEYFYQDPLNLLIYREYKSYLQKHLLTLDSESYLVIYYHFFEFMSFSEISTIFSQAPSTTYYWYNKGLKFLRQSLRKDSYEQYLI